MQAFVDTLEAEDSFFQNEAATCICVDDGCSARGVIVCDRTAMWLVQDFVTSGSYGKGSRSGFHAPRAPKKGKGKGVKQKGSLSGMDQMPYLPPGVRRYLFA